MANNEPFSVKINEILVNKANTQEAKTQEIKPKIVLPPKTQTRPKTSINQLDEISLRLINDANNKLEAKKPDEPAKSEMKPIQKLEKPALPPKIKPSKPEEEPKKASPTRIKNDIDEASSAKNEQLLKEFERESQASSTATINNKLAELLNNINKVPEVQPHTFQIPALRPVSKEIPVQEKVEPSANHAVNRLRRLNRIQN